MGLKRFHITSIRRTELTSWKYHEPQPPSYEENDIFYIKEKNYNGEQGPFKVVRVLKDRKYLIRLVEPEDGDYREQVIKERQIILDYD